ncbi:MAG: zf-HC2 domain-containing protein [Myxococcota bacterium]
MAENRLVGGLECFDVLAVLSDYLDGELDAGTRAKVEAHLAGCDACTTFGGEFGAVVKALREKMKRADAPVGAAELEKLGL